MLEMTGGIDALSFLFLGCCHLLHSTVAWLSDMLCTVVYSTLLIAYQTSCLAKSSHCLQLALHQCSSMLKSLYAFLLPWCSWYVICANINFKSVTIVVQK